MPPRLLERVDVMMQARRLVVVARNVEQRLEVLASSVASVGSDHLCVVRRSTTTSLLTLSLSFFLSPFSFLFPSY